MAKWKGYITFGFIDQARLLESLNACFEQESFNAIQVEPGRIFNAVGSTRRTINVWNENRTHSKTDNECRDKVYQTSDPYVLNYIGSPDEIRLGGGYQIDVQAQSSQGVLIRAVVGGGEFGEPIDEIPLFQGELPPAGSDFLDGGVSCDKVLRSINGVSTPHFTISTDTGVVIRSHPLLNRVVVNVNGENLNYCTDFENTTVDCLPASKDYCGPAEGVAVLCPGPPDKKAGYTNIEQDIETGGGGSINLNQVYGTCTYRKEIEGWLQTAAAPSFNCVCSPPTIGGHLGQVITTRAVATPGVQPFYVRNAQFLETLANWQIDAASHEHVLESSLFDDMPYLELTNGTLSQPFIPVEPRSLRVQASYICDASVVVRVINHRTGMVLLNQTFLTAVSESQILSDYFATTGTDIVVSFQTSGTLKITEVGLIPWQ